MTSTLADFRTDIQARYADGDAGIQLGAAMLGTDVQTDVPVSARLGMLNRHGVISGATGTGKTKSLQVMAEALSAHGVPVLITDIKGDVSGMAAPGKPDGGAAKRAAQLGTAFNPEAQPVEFWALGGVGDGTALRGTVSEFGAQLMAKVLGANETQEQALYLVFAFADSHHLPLVDLGDLRAVLQHLASDAGAVDLDGIGGVSKQTVGVLLREITMLEANDAAPFFDVPPLAMSDLMRTTPDGRGIINIVELPKLANSPQVFSAALMWIVAELFEQLPEVGDLDKPKLVVFIDEAHLIFDDASDAFIDSITRTVRLIRSKGVGIFLSTQNPQDIHEDVLGQLGMRIQHALRAYTPQDQKAIKVACETMPTTTHFDVEAEILALGIGEAIVTTLDEKGAPRPPVRTCMLPPRSSMDALADIAAVATSSPLAARYAELPDPDSAAEMLQRKLEDATASTTPVPAKGTQTPDEPRMTSRDPQAPRPRRPTGDSSRVADILNSRTGRQIQREVVRGIFGIIKQQMRGR